MFCFVFPQGAQFLSSLTTLKEAKEKSNLTHHFLATRSLETESALAENKSSINNINNNTYLYSVLNSYQAGAKYFTSVILFIPLNALVR